MSEPWRYHGPPLDTLTPDEVLATCRWALAVLESDAATAARSEQQGRLLSAQLEEAERRLRARRAEGRLDDLSDYVRDRIRFWAAEMPGRPADHVWCIVVREARAAGYPPPSQADTVRVLREGTVVTTADRIWLLQAGIADA
jgi:hypothetical protein